MPLEDLWSVTDGGEDGSVWTCERVVVTDGYSGLGGAVSV